MSTLIRPRWAAPASVMACSTTRAGGVSLPPYASLNLGAHVGDNPADVAANRLRLVELAGLPAMPFWLEQVHGTDVLRLEGQAPSAAALRADAVYTAAPGQVCAVMTADCLPVLFASRKGDEVAAAHAGWRGLCAGVLENTLTQFRCPPDEVMAWFGPAIGPDAFEVGAEVRAAFVAENPATGAAFRPAGTKYMADIYQLARIRLQAAGVRHISGGERCTVSESDNFFSFRRDGTTGRLATLIWLI
ncbi:peptidoglycan editing factor PgeF [Chimaeribacter californicus]|uniref:Purine nucleoside phosphorylase n=1 Tax=Chimaeribacter californicus TaxID=2060067 RepID=A0A2N5EED9_9GAMM|nr:purine nucleoside phosphorylase YfiH [Chimaeribacter californicus]PLR40903.1 peptidoglycan editing factor PgeF [Chimaeribacter californicus]